MFHTEFLHFVLQRHNIEAKINSFKLVVESKSAPEIKRKEAQNKVETLKKELDDMVRFNFFHKKSILIIRYELSFFEYF